MGKVVLSLFICVFLASIWAFCKLASDLSREEEEKRHLYELGLRKGVMTMGEETCVCCGAIIPEGRQVCRDCENGEEP